MNKAPIGLFYGSSTCYTEMCAEKIQQYFGQDTEGNPYIDVFNIAESGLNTMADYPQLILGIPTWDYGELQEDWEDIWDDIDTINFSGKTVALFGLGDQVGYPDWFLDALGYLHNKIVLLGANIIGYWPNQGYTFNESQALNADHTQFVGLALDDENQFEQSEQRIAQWCEQLKQTFTL
jgi:flavodoxin II